MIAADIETARWFIEQHGAAAPLSVAITGAHAFGFATVDSDLDLKGIHVTPTADLLAIHRPPHALDVLTEFDGMEIDYASHELGFALRLLVRGNGDMLERILSPFQVLRSDGRQWLQGLTRGSVSRRFYPYYLRTFRRIQAECVKAGAPTARRYLFAYRSALTGIHLLRTGECVLDVEVLSRDYGFGAVADLLAHQRAGAEVESSADVLRYESDWPRLEEMLQAALYESPLPQSAANVDSLSAFLVEERRRRF